MITATAAPFMKLPGWTPPESLMKLAEPAHKVLAGFIHGCATDEATCTAATTALVLSFWQLQGRRLTTQAPSLLLVNAGEANADPIDEFIRPLVYNERENQPEIQTQGPFMGAPLEMTPETMRLALLLRRALGPNLAGSPARQLEAQNAEQRFHAASIAAFGLGRCRPYARAWHPEYGLLTDRNDEIILRLNDEEDRGAFVKDLKEPPKKLVFPQGIGPDLFPVPKGISLSGSVTLKQARKAIRLVNFSQPVFLLPHLSTEPLKLENLPGLGALAMTWSHARIRPVPTSPRLPPSDWTTSYRDALRKRLALLPADYDFAIQQMLRQLDGICDRIVCFAGDLGASEQELALLVRDIYSRALRGMTLSVAGLSWFGMGLYLGPDCEPLRERAVGILHRLRSKGPLTMNDLLKNFRLKAEERDALLERLSAERLVRSEGKTVIATSYQEFVEGLYAREEFPPVEPCSPEARKP